MTLDRILSRWTAIAGLTAISLAGCGGGDDNNGSSSDLIFGIAAGNTLVRFNPAAPNAVTTIGPITGLGVGENVLGIDFRPASGELFALSSASKIYTINQNTGAATIVGAGFTPVLSGSVFGFDFNPTVDRIRVVSDAEQSFRLNPNTGAVAGSDTNLAYVVGDPNAGNTPDVVAAAYTNNVNPAPGTTTLFGIDTSRDALVRIGGVDGNPSPNIGGLTTIGALGLDATSGSTSFDIAADGIAFAAVTVAGVRNLYRVNLSTGALTLVGQIGANVSEIAIAR